MFCKATSSPRERLFKMLTAFNFDEIAEDYVDYDLFERLEAIIKKLQDDDKGVTKISQKKFRGSVQLDIFTGAEFIQTLQRILEIEHFTEAVHLGNLLLHHGYIYSNDHHSSQVLLKEDTTHFRFQNSKYWPSQKPDGSEEEYAVYLVKKKMLSKDKNGLRQDELVYFTKLLELFGSRWSSVMKAAEEQYRVLKEKKKSERILIMKEEEAFWRVHRLREDETNVFDAGYKSYTNRFSRKDLRTLSTLQTEVNALKDKTQRIRIPTSVAFNNLACHCYSRQTIDVLLDSKSDLALSSSRWLKDFMPRTLSLDSLRLETWKISLVTLLSDHKGIEELEKFLQKEFSDENLRFWLRCEELRYAEQSKIKTAVIQIYRDFVAPGAKNEINVDNKAMQEIRDGIQTPFRYAFDLAQSQIFNLMNTDSYPRFLKSARYKELVESAKNAKTSNARKSNNRLLQAAKGFVKRQASNDVIPDNNDKTHMKLVRSSSDFPSGNQTSGLKIDSPRSFGSSQFYLEVASSTLDRSRSENDLFRLGDSTPIPTTPIIARSSGLRAAKLKGLPILKLSRSVTPTASPIGSPSLSSSGFGNRISPVSSPRSSRKMFHFGKDNYKKSSPLCLNELEQKLNAVQSSRDVEQSQDINDWHWQKISHDFA